MTSVTWMKAANGRSWCPFATTDLSGLNTFGVYVIWHGGTAPRTVYVGQGKIAERIEAHRADERITGYDADGPLFFTWAELLAADADGAERYLAELLSPLVSDGRPEVALLAVNSPFAA